MVELGEMTTVLLTLTLVYLRTVTQSSHDMEGLFYCPSEILSLLGALLLYLK